MKIVLIGYRAAGKSTLGRRLEQCLGWPCRDVDRGIEAICGTDLAQFYKKIGDTAFRDIEAQVVADLCAEDRCIISMGAGSLTRPENQQAVSRDSLVVYLELPAEELWRRIEADPRSALDRPNLRGGGLEEVQQMLALRHPVYCRCADLRLDGTLPTEQLSQSVLEQLDDRPPPPQPTGPER